MPALLGGTGIIGKDIFVKMKAQKSASIQTASGTVVTFPQSEERAFSGLSIYGHSTQDGTPSPENPVPIVSAGDSGEIEAKVYGGNLISSDISNWNINGWNASDNMLQLSDGIKIKAMNGWIKVYYDTSEMNGKTLNLSFDYQQIESETTSPSASLAFSIVVQNENVYPEANSDIFPFQTDSPETVKTHVSVSFIARNYLCFLLRVNTEGVGETRAIEVTNIMLNAGNTELTYEPYKTPQSIVLSTPNGLPGISVISGGNYTDADGQQWVCDEIDFKRGKYVQRVKKFVVTSDTDIGSLNPYATAVLDVVQPFRVVEYNGQIIKLSAMMAKNFVVRNTWNAAEEAAYTTEQTIDFNILNERIGTNAESTSEEAVAAVREWLKDNPLTFLCQLITPIETDLPAEEIAAYKALHTYSPTTTASNDAGAWMEVGYNEFNKRTF